MVFTTAPHAPFVPEPARGQPVVMVNICLRRRSRGGREGRRAASTRSPAGRRTWCQSDELPRGSRSARRTASGLQSYSTADFLRELPDEADRHIRAATHSGRCRRNRRSSSCPGGGAPSRVDEEATAFGAAQRAVQHPLSSRAWPNPADNEANIARVKELSAIDEAVRDGRVYLNFIGNEGRGADRRARSASRRWPGYALLKIEVGSARISSATTRTSSHWRAGHRVFAATEIVPSWRGPIARRWLDLPNPASKRRPPSRAPACCAGVAQLVRASACHAEGRGFEPRLSRHYFPQIVSRLVAVRCVAPAKLRVGT